MKNTADRLPLAVLLGSAAFVAAVTFAVSAHGLVDFGERVMGLPPWMSWCVPVGADFLQLVAIAAWFLNRKKPKPVRFYMWVLMAAAIGASMAGNRWDALERHLPTAGVNATMIVPVMLALSAHAIVITWRHQEPTAVAVAEPATKPATDKPKTAKAAKPKLRVVADERAKAMADAVAMAATGKGSAEIAMAVEIPEATVRRWIKQAAPSLNGAEPVGEPA